MRGGNIMPVLLVWTIYIFFFYVKTVNILNACRLSIVICKMMIIGTSNG